MESDVTMTSVELKILNYSTKALVKIMGGKKDTVNTQ